MFKRVLFVLILEVKTDDPSLDSPPEKDDVALTE